MHPSRKVIFAAIGIALLASPFLLAQFHREIPLRNWTVPAFDASTLGNQPGIRPMTHFQGNNPAVFVPITPCRLEDSRTTAVPPGPGPIGGPGVGAERAYDFVPGGGDTCTGGFSDPVLALSLNFSIVGAFGPGFLYAYPTGGTPPPVSILNYNAGEIRNNAAIVPVNASTGSITVGTGVNGTDVIIDINGIFLNALEPNTSFTIISEVDDAAIVGQNTSSAANAQGVRGIVSSTTPGASARGVYGLASATTGATFGVFGESNSTSNGAAGVLGVMGSRITVGGAGTFFETGVRGEGNGTSANGAVGIIFNTSTGFGVGGFSYTTAGGNVLIGQLANEASNLGVSYTGGLGGTGAKAFLEPHPTDAGKMIRYISLEGPEPGTYFRGRGRIQNGIAVIEVPESFRIVTDPEGLSIQVTPIGQMATVAVESIGLERIVIRGSRNVEFFYTVNGVRTAYKDLEVITENNFFVPRSPDEEMSLALSAVERQRLINNGTYRPDGKVNMETAQRLGWDRVWTRRPPPAPVPDE